MMLPENTFFYHLQTVKAIVILKRVDVINYFKETESHIIMSTETHM